MRLTGEIISYCVGTLLYKESVNWMFALSSRISTYFGKIHDLLIVEKMDLKQFVVNFAVTME